MNELVSHSYPRKSLFVVVEADLIDPVFLLMDDGFNLGDIFGWVKAVTVGEVSL